MGELTTVLNLKKLDQMRRQRKHQEGGRKNQALVLKGVEDCLLNTGWGQRVVRYKKKIR